MAGAELPTLVHGYLTRQVAALLDGIDAIRGGDFRVVHRTRVAVRRLRSTLRTFAPAYDDEAVAGLDDELRWLAVTLGQVRDREVLRLVVDEFVSRQSMGAGLHIREALRQALHRRLDAEEAAHVSEVRRALSSERCRDLLGRVAALPTRAPVAAPLGDPLPRRRRLVARRLARAVADGAPERLHHARKAVKRARYAAEAVAGPELSAERGPADPLPPAVAAAQRFEEVQECLGRFQDLTVARRFVADAAAEERLLADQLDHLGAAMETEAALVREEALKLAESHGLLTPPPPDRTAPGAARP